MIAPALKTKLLTLIALFEGSAGGRINTYDGQLLSLGTLHYAVGQGPGVRFLERVVALDPAGALSCLGPQFTQAIKAGQTVQFCRKHVAGSKRWDRAFVALSRLPAFAQADAELAENYFRIAEQIAGRYRLTSERGLAFAFDRAVQQGGKVRPLVERAYQQHRNSDEVTRMRALAEAYADSANPRWHDTVRARALTVATGSSAGTGYPGRVNLETGYGISAARPWVAPADPYGVVKLVVPGGGEELVWNGRDIYHQQNLRELVPQLRQVYPRCTGPHEYGGVLKVWHRCNGELVLERLPVDPTEGIPARPQTK